MGGVGRGEGGGGGRGLMRAGIHYVVKDVLERGWWVVRITIIIRWRVVGGRVRGRIRGRVVRGIFVKGILMGGVGRSGGVISGSVAGGWAGVQKLRLVLL